MQDRFGHPPRSRRPDRLIRPLFLALALAASPGAPALAEIVNSAVASGSHQGVTVLSRGAQTIVRVAPAEPALQVGVEAAMTGEPAPGLPDGSAIAYAVSVSNTGNVGLVGMRLSLELKQGEKTFAPSDAPRYEGGDIENPGILDRGETWRYTARYVLQRANLETGGAIVASAVATGRAGESTASARDDLETAVPRLQGVERSLLSLVHTPSTTETKVGDQVDYTLSVANRGDKPLTVRLRALLSEGVRLVPGSVLEGSRVVDVTLDGQRVDFGEISVPARDRASLRYLGEVALAPVQGYLVNTAQIADSQTLIPLLPPSSATIRTADQTPDGCASVSLLVYEDRNRNGFAEPDENGILGARVSAGEGYPMTTDAEGRFATPCLEVTALSEIGLEFALDDDTLPEGYHPTTPDPVTVRVAAGDDVVASFGVASARILHVDLNAAAFRRNELVPDEDLSDGITRLISVLKREPSVLRLSYFANRERVDLPEERLDMVRRTILDRWIAAGAGYDLKIETRVVHGNG